MSRRGYDRRRKCGEGACREWSTSHYDLKRDYVDAVRREKGQPPWKCLRHSKPEKVLGVHNVEITSDCVRIGYGSRNSPMWEGAYQGGWATGPGFMAWAEDFPLGTKLTITARIEFPEGFEPPPPPPPPKQPSRYDADAVDLDKE